jgi:hypothetical protein
LDFLFARQDFSSELFVYVFHSSQKGIGISELEYKYAASHSMKTSFKTLVRAMSPFAGPKGRQPQEPERSYADFHWDLTKVDMETMLTNFYRIYNPERVALVPQILGEFGGEEILMLQQLCERYKLDEADVQRFLDEAPLGKKDRFGNWMRRNETEPAASVATEGRDGSYDYTTFKWDLEGVDLAKALKLLYRAHNPEKKPNVATLQNKSTADRILLLQQLCKRHGLSQGDMREFLDKARVKAEKTSVSSSNNRNAGVADDSSVSSKGRAALEAAVGLFSSPAPRPLPPAPTAQTAASSPSPSRSAASTQDDAPNVITGGGLQRQGSLPFWQNSFPSPFGAASPPPPPPPPPTPPRPPHSAISGFLAESLASRGSPGSEVASVNSSVTAPSLTSGMGRSKLGAAVAARAASTGAASVHSVSRQQRAPSPSPSVLTTSSIGSASVGRGPRAASAGASASRAITSPAAEETAARRNSTRSNSDTTASKQLPPRAARGSNAAAESTIADSTGLSDARAEEVLRLQQELADAKTQAAGLQKENRALLKALQESKQRQNDAESTISALSSQPHPEQVPELLLEVSKLNAALQQQEGGLRACALRWLSL